MAPVKSFRGRFAFLSNSYPSSIPYEGILYNTVEAAYQAAKTWNHTLRQEIASLPSPQEVKSLGRKIPLRKDWESVKVSVMEELIYIKFSRNDDLRLKLLSTRYTHLEEGNRHGDTFWGTVDGQGLNKLGFIIMQVRDKLRFTKGPPPCVHHGGWSGR